jgi:hypothetical protein
MGKIELIVSEVRVNFDERDYAFVKVADLAPLPTGVNTIHAVRFVSRCGAIPEGQEGVAVRTGFFLRVFVRGFSEVVYPLRGQIVLA